MEMEWLLSGASDDPSSSAGQQLMKFIMKRVNHVVMRKKQTGLLLSFALKRVPLSSVTAHPSLRICQLREVHPMIGLFCC